MPKVESPLFGDQRDTGQSAVAYINPKSWPLGLRFHGTLNWFGPGTSGVAKPVMKLNPMQPTTHWFRLRSTSVRGLPWSPRMWMDSICALGTHGNEPSKSTATLTTFETVGPVHPENACLTCHMSMPMQHSIPTGRIRCFAKQAGHG